MTLRIARAEARILATNRRSVGSIYGENIMTASTKGTALITGASAGIGAIYADRLAKRGYDLILVARNETRLNALASRLTGETVDAMEAMIALNVTALTRLTYAVAPVFAAKGAGTIINISSVVGIAVELLNGVYSASKSYVLSFGHALQRDLADKGVRVQTVLPAATATEFWDVAGYAKQKEAASTMSAADLVDAALAGLDQGELVTIPTLHDGNGWTQWEADRRALTPQFANAKAAPRYAPGAQSGV
jgi:uncharacterized protein